MPSVPSDLSLSLGMDKLFVLWFLSPFFFFFFFCFGWVTGVTLLISYNFLSHAFFFFNPTLTVLYCVYIYIYIFMNGPFLSLSLFSLLLFSNGVWFYLLFLVFPFLGCLSIVLWFLDVFASLVHFLCTGLCSFNILLSYLSKKKLSL